MLVLETLASISDHLSVYLLSVLIAGIVAIGINYYYVKNIVSGLISVQVSFIFNTAIILFGWWEGAVSLFRVMHFLVYELIVVLGVYLIYRKILRNRSELYERLQRLDIKTVSVLLVLYNSIILYMVLKYVGGNTGASRIGYMTTGWYSYFRPISFILDPLGLFFPIYLLDRGKRILPLFLIVWWMIPCTLSGSKASFIAGAVLGVLLYQDLKGAKLAISRSLKVSLIIGLSLVAMLTLVHLDVSMTDMAERFARTGESTIMVYYSDDPTAAASGVSTLAKVHRGVAKLLGDRSAADPDTLFGFALSRVEYGSNTLTGPNATISSYMMCNYSGWENLIAVISIIGYLAIVMWFYNVFIYMQSTAMVVLVPFVVGFLNNFPQDYNNGASTVTAICIYVLIFTWISIATIACKGASSHYDTA